MITLFFVLHFLGSLILVGLINDHIGHGPELPDGLVLVFKNIEPEIGHRLLHPDDLVDLGLMVGKININT